MNTDNDWPNEITDFTKPGVKDLPEYEVNAWWRCCCFATKEEADKLSAQWSLEPQHPSQHPLRAPVGYMGPQRSVRLHLVWGER